MPTYVYACSQCHEVSEIEQRITEPSLTDCPVCGTAGTVKRVIQPVGISFKGSGFYVNDSQKSTPTPKTDKAPPEKADTDKGEPAKASPETTETKAETKETQPAATPQPTPAAPAAKTDSP